MGYDTNPAMVRVGFFKPSGKWYTTEAVKWTGKYKLEEGKTPKEDDGWNIHKQFAKSLCDHLKGRMSDMDAVCLHPYHKNEHPIMLKGGSWINYGN